MMELTQISLASYTDAAQISRMSRDLIEYGLSGTRYTERAVRNAIYHEAKNVAVSKQGSTVRGFGIMTYHDYSANLDLLAVLPAYQGSGLADDIVAWLESVAQNAGISQIGVQARARNKRAIGFYQRQGYGVVKRTLRVYGPEAQISMVKRLQ